MKAGDLEELRRAFAAGLAAVPPPAACPAPETIWQAVRGELSRHALREVADHAAACPACTEDWRLALAFEGPLDRALAGADAAPREAVRGRFRFAPVWLTAAAAAAALFVVAILLRQPAPVPTLRGGVQAERPRLLTGAEAVLPRERCLLRWSGPRGATYDVEVRTESGRSVARMRGLSTPSQQVPAADFAAYPPGTVFEWQVTATLPDGRRVASLPGTFSLR